MDHKAGSQSSSAAPRDAGPPFDHDDADIILRSSDMVDFRVHKLMLSKAFGAFAEMFGHASSGTGADQEMRAGIPVAHLPECSETIDAILRFVYVVERDRLNDVRKLWSVCATLDKYCVNCTPEALRTDLLAATEHSPGAVYAIARVFRLQDVAKAAAEKTLKRTMSIMEIPKRFLVCMDGLQYNALFEYHRTCHSVVVKSTFERLDWLPQERIPGMRPFFVALDESQQQCKCGRYVQKLIEWIPDSPEKTIGKRKAWGLIPPWLDRYLELVKDALRTSVDGSIAESAVKQQSFVSTFDAARRCSLCREGRKKLDPFVELLRNEINHRIRQVDFDKLYPDST